MEYHECDKLKGKIIDVTTRGTSIYCRRCGGQLEDSQVDLKMLKQISNLRNKGKYVH